ncbi:MAG: hypothetical protein ACJ735_14280 [Actinomycetes bacterium]
MTAPRFLLVSGKKVDGLTSPRWPGGHAPFVGESHPDGSWLAWRLAGANNRELGRSASVYPDLHACQASILSMRAGIVHAQPVVAMDYLSGLWGWHLELDGSNVAVSGRAYRRERECRYNLRQFLSAARAADLVTERV